MKILTWTILKKTQIFNGCETFAFKYINVYKNTFFWCIKEMSQRDVSFTHPKHMFDRRTSDKIIFLGYIHIYVYLFLI